MDPCECAWTALEGRLWPGRTAFFGPGGPPCLARPPSSDRRAALLGPGPPSSDREGHLGRGPPFGPGGPPLGPGPPSSDRGRPSRTGGSALLRTGGTASGRTRGATFARAGGASSSRGSVNFSLVLFLEHRPTMGTGAVVFGHKAVTDFASKHFLLCTADHVNSAVFGTTQQDLDVHLMALQRNFGCNGMLERF